jgi:hypothetical protein
MNKLQILREAIEILNKQDKNVDVKKAILEICLADSETKIAN